MTPILGGIHHVTAITPSAQGNIDFYSGVLGLMRSEIEARWKRLRLPHTSGEATRG